MTATFGAGMTAGPQACGLLVPGGVGFAVTEGF